MFQALLQNFGPLVFASAEGGEPAGSNVLQDIGVCIVAATVLAYFARLAKQPPLLAYIVAGIVIGPIGLRLVKDTHSIDTLAQLGIAFLLFIVGMEIDIRKIVRTAKLSAPVTIVQVLGCMAMGWIVAMPLGFHGIPALYIAAAAGLSSTMIMIKLLSDRSELSTTHGQMTLGVALWQDVVAIVLLSLQPQIGGDVPWHAMALSAVKGLGLVAATVLISRYVLPLVFRWVATSPEVMLLTALSWCFLTSYAAVKLEFSSAMGALIAGVSISAFPYALDVVAKIRGLRDFFVTLFFVSLGMLLVKPTGQMLMGAGIVSAVVVLSRFVTVWPAMRLLGHSSRTGLLCSVYLAPLSEFGLVLALIGASSPLNHVNRDLVSLVVVVLIITSTLAAYLIQYSHKIAAWMIPHASRSEGDPDASTVLVRDGTPAPVMLIGCWRVGSSLVHELRQATIDFTVVDFSPRTNARLNKLGVNTIYGDISHLDTLEHAGVAHAKILICSITDDFLRGTDNRKLLHHLRRLNPGARIVVTSDSIEEAKELYREGADYVIVPRVLIARHVMNVIAEIGAEMLPERRANEVEHLPNRTEVVP